MYICRQRAAMPCGGSVLRRHAGGSGAGRRDACCRAGLAVRLRRCERYKPAATSAVLRLAVACATLGALAKGASTTGASMRQSVASIPCLLRDACSLPRRQSEATAPEGGTGPWGPLRLRGGSRKNSKKNWKAKHRFQCQVLARTPPQRARVRCRCLVCLCSSLSPPPPPPLSFSLSLSRARAFSLIQPRIQVYNTETRR